MSGGADAIREELARLRITVSTDDLDAIAKLVAGNRDALARVPAGAIEDPDVSHGFVPPAPPDPVPPADGTAVRRAEAGRTPRGARDDP